MESNVTLLFLTWAGLACLFFNNKNEQTNKSFEKRKGPEYEYKYESEGNGTFLYSRERSSNKPLRCATILVCRRIGRRSRKFNTLSPCPKFNPRPSQSSPHFRNSMTVWKKSLQELIKGAYRLQRGSSRPKMTNGLVDLRHTCTWQPLQDLKCP